MICERYVIPKEVRVLLFWYGFYVFIRGGFENSAESSFPIKSFRLLWLNGKPKSFSANFESERQVSARRHSTGQRAGLRVSRVNRPRCVAERN